MSDACLFLAGLFFIIHFAASTHSPTLAHEKKMVQEPLPRLLQSLALALSEKHERTPLCMQSLLTTRQAVTELSRHLDGYTIDLANRSIQMTDKQLQQRQEILASGCESGVT